MSEYNALGRKESLEGVLLNPQGASSSLSLKSEKPNMTLNKDHLVEDVGQRNQSLNSGNLEQDLENLVDYELAEEDFHENGGEDLLAQSQLHKEGPKQTMISETETSTQKTQITPEKL